TSLTILCFWSLTFASLSFFISPVAVCSGTQNGMSTTGDPENHYKLMKERYTGCNIVMGNLEIILMQHTRDFSFLQVSLGTSKNRTAKPLMQLTLTVL
uniref:Uncharacterized protein n=1 Tax=Xiphophorus couchianus TaxID=32473 RepID=A0A3B5N0I2_9TELE